MASRGQVTRQGENGRGISLASGIPDPDDLLTRLAEIKAQRAAALAGASVKDGGGNGPVTPVRRSPVRLATVRGENGPVSMPELPDDERPALEPALPGVTSRKAPDQSVGETRARPSVSEMMNPAFLERRLAEARRKRAEVLAKHPLQTRPDAPRFSHNYSEPEALSGRTPTTVQQVLRAPRPGPEVTGPVPKPAPVTLPEQESPDTGSPESAGPQQEAGTGKPETGNSKAAGSVFPRLAAALVAGAIIGAGLYGFFTSRAPVETPPEAGLTESPAAPMADPSAAVTVTPLAPATMPAAETAAMRVSSTAPAIGIPADGSGSPQFPPAPATDTTRTENPNPTAFLAAPGSPGPSLSAGIQAPLFTKPPQISTQIQSLSGATSRSPLSLRPATANVPVAAFNGPSLSPPSQAGQAAGRLASLPAPTHMISAAALPATAGTPLPDRPAPQIAPVLTKGTPVLTAPDLSGAALALTDTDIRSAPQAAGQLRSSSVMIHFPRSAASTAGSAEAALLNAGAAGTLVSPAGFSISRNNIRYYYSQDAAVAGEVAAVLAAMTPPILAEVRDFTGFSPLPARGLVEVWLAGEPPAAAPAVTRKPAAKVRTRSPQPSRVERRDDAIRTQQERNIERLLREKLGK